MSKPLAHRITRQSPHQIDPIEDGDLDSIYSGDKKPIADGNPLSWGLIATVVTPAWSPPEDVFAAGPDWQAIFKADGHQVPEMKVGAKASRATGKKAGRPTVVLLVETGTTTLNGTRDVGRPRAQSLLGLLQMKLVRLRGSTVLWEGVVNPRNNRSTAVGLDYEARSLSPDQLKRDVLPLSKASLGSLPAYLSLGLRWYAKAWLDRNRIDRFVNFWLSAVVLIDHGFSRPQLSKIPQRERIVAYVKGFAAVSGARRATLAKRLKRAYAVRNEVVHQGNTANLGDQILRELEESVTEIFQLEMESVG